MKAIVPEIMGQKLADGLLVICDITVVDLGKYTRGRLVQNFKWTVEHLSVKQVLCQTSSFSHHSEIVIKCKVCWECVEVGQECSCKGKCHDA